MSEPLRVPVILWQNQKVATQNGKWPTLNFDPQKPLAAQVQAAWGLEVWPLHDGGLGVGHSGTPHFEVLDGDGLRGQLPAGMTWAEANVPPLDRARRWQLPGWPAQASALAGGRPVAPVFSHDLNAMVQVGTPPQQTYLKVSDTGKEMRVTAYLARTLPEVLPPVLEVNEAEHWQLVVSGGALLDSVDDLDAWAEALERLAGFQTGADAGALAALGCPVYPLTEMQERVLDLLSNTAVLRAWGVAPDKIEGLQAACPSIRRGFVTLAALNLPELPAHGDAHPRNALYGERGAVWFDWAEAATAHPFMDVGWFLAFTLLPARAQLPIRQRCSDLETRLAGTYTSALGCPEAAPLLRQAIPLALLHRAAVYDLHFRHWEGTVPGWRPQYVPYYLRLAAGELERLY